MSVAVAQIILLISVRSLGADIFLRVNILTNVPNYSEQRLVGKKLRSECVAQTLLIVFIRSISNEIASVSLCSMSKLLILMGQLNS